MRPIIYLINNNEEMSMDYDNNSSLIPISAITLNDSTAKHNINSVKR